MLAHSAVGRVTDVTQHSGQPTPIVVEDKAMCCAVAEDRFGVINGRYQLEMRRPLFPRKQTWIGPARAGKLGEFQRFSPGGLFGLSFNFLRMNQPRRMPLLMWPVEEIRHVEGLGNCGRT